MDPDVLLFFQTHLSVLPLYEAFAARVLDLDPETTVRVSRTQISFFARRMFACVSFLPVHRGPKPPAWLTLTFGLGRRLDSPRIDAAVEPRPGRWTHHLLLSDPAQLDDTLMAWIREAHDFARAKR